MSVIKEWKCPCGYIFESDLPICPQCCSTEVTRIFLTAPGFKGDKTKVKDRSLKEFTEFYGLSNFSNNQNQSHEKDFSKLWKPKSDILDETNLSGGELPLIKELMPTAKKRITQPLIVNTDRKQ